MRAKIIEGPEPRRDLRIVVESENEPEAILIRQFRRQGDVNLVLASLTDGGGEGMVFINTAAWVPREKIVKET
jgi:hypothetical protein